MNNPFRSHKAAVAVMLAGLLTALLFSGGEGVQLFPFPPVAFTYELDQIDDGGIDREYHPNAPRVEKLQHKPQLRLPREREDAAAVSRTTPVRRPIIVASSRPFNVDQKELRRCPQIVAATSDGRAPPQT